MAGLPRDVVLMILRKLDIDSRRVLGVYTRLRVPDALRTALGACMRRRCALRVAFGPQHRHVVMHRHLGSAELCDYGLSPAQYAACEAVNFDVFEGLAQLDEGTVRRHGFADVADFINAYGRALLYNYRNYTLDGFMTFHHSKALRFHPGQPVPGPPESGDLLRYICSYDFAWLVSVGW